MSIGQRIRNRREAMQITQGQLATAIGMTPQYISAIERDKKSPSLSVLAKLAIELAVSIDYLVTGRETIITDIIPVIKADETLDLEVRNALITLIHELRKDRKAKVN